MLLIDKANNKHYSIITNHGLTVEEAMELAGVDPHYNEFGEYVDADGDVIDVELFEMRY